MSILDPSNSFDELLRSAKGQGTPTKSSGDASLDRLKDAETTEKAATAAKAVDAKNLVSDEAKEKTKLDSARSQLDDSSKLFEQVQSWKPEPPQQSIYKTYGTLASGLAMLAAGLTKQPLINALNAGAAVAEGQKSRDQAGYEKAFEAWQANMKLAFEKHNAQMADYKTAQIDHKDNIDELHTNYEINAKRYQDDVAEKLLFQGRYEEHAELMMRRAEMGVRLQAATDELSQKKQMNDLVQQGLKELGPNATPEQKMTLIGQMKAKAEGKITEAPTLAQDEAKIVSADAQKLMKKAAADGKPIPFEEASRDAYLQFDKDKKASEKGAGTTGSSASESRVNQRVLVEAKDAVTALKNMVQLPITSSAGFFGGSTTSSEGMFSAPRKYLEGALTPNQVDAYNTLSVGLGRALSGIEVGGIQVNQHISDQFEKLALKPTDTHLTAALKLAQMKQGAQNGLLVLATNPHLALAQQELTKDMLTQLDETIPWSVSDAIKMQFGGEPGDTFKSFAEKSGLGKTGEVSEGPPTQAIEMLKKSPETADQFDEIFGPGAAKKVLGNE